jgi:hypothetical protein
MTSASETSRKEYYAFVESIERIAPALPPTHLSPGLSGILAARRECRLPKPTHVVVLDCIDQGYFDALPWKGSTVSLGAPAEGEQRRRDLQSIPKEQLRAVLLLLEWHDQEGMLGEFLTAAWHRVVVGAESGCPSAVGMDFEGAIEGPFEVEFLRHEESFRGDAMQPFTSVFNLDFIPDMTLDEDYTGGSHSPLPPDKPAPTSAAAKPWKGDLGHWGGEEEKGSEAGQSGFLSSGG